MSEPRKSPALRPEAFVVDDDPAVCRVLQALLRQAGCQAVTFATAGEAIAALDAHEPRVVVLDIMLPDLAGDAALLRLRERRPDLPVILISAQDSVQRAVEIMKLKPYEYFVKPIEHDRMVRSVERAIHEYDLTQRVHQLEREVLEAYRFDQIIGVSPRMKLLYDHIQQVLDNRVTVFIFGESGTGKELVAKAIHYHGTRRTGPFVALNCGAIPESLQESELFGHERGSFTGAVATHRGRFEQANHGTLFLDEVAELSPAVQTRLLRVLQEQTVDRVGSKQAIAVDVRIIAATHRDLERMVKEGRFREDLYYRLVVFPIEVPPLRDRREDIPLLVQHFTRVYRTQLGGGERSFERDALDVLCRYDWPGNVRELENVVQRSMLARTSGIIGVSALPPKIVMRSMGLDERVESPAVAAPDGIVPLAEVERRAIAHALRALDGNVSLAAKRLGVGRATIYRKLSEFPAPASES